MEWNWEIGIPKSLAVSSQENGHYHPFLGSSCKDTMEVEASGLLNDQPMMQIGLKLGRQSTYCQEQDGTSLFPLVPESLCSPIIKRSRASYQSSHLPRCQVEGCDLDLATSKDYHRRHRICAHHSKSPKVVVAGMERRFCQQCSRLHDLSEFDDRKRSCRRRLSAHNARRRRPQSEDNKFGYTHRRPQMGFLVNPSPSTTPKSSSNFKGVDMMSNGGLSDISSSFHGVIPRSLNHGGLEANSNGSHCLSIEATSSWGFNGHDDEPSCFDQFIHGHNIGLTQPGMQSNRNTHDFDCFCPE